VSEEALVEASEVVLEQAAKEVLKGQFKATMMRYRVFNC
jgi:hypothetical protein